MGIAILAGNILFAAGFFLAVAGIYRQRKSEKTLLGIAWGVISVLMVLCFHVLAAPVVMALQIPCSVTSFGILDAVLGISLLFYEYRTGSRQEYVWEKLDVFAILGLAVFVAALGVIRYGFPVRFVYISTDAATHYHEAFMVFLTGKVDAMYFSSLNNSFLLSFFSMIYKETDLYRAESYIDMIWLYLSGISLYAFIRKDNWGKCGKIAGGGLLLLYLLGYPLNHMITGFLYQGMGVTLVIFLWKILEEYLEGNASENTAQWYLLAGCGGLICCYALYVPPVFLAVFVILAWKAWSERKVFYVWAAREFFVFAYPCFIGLWFTYRGIFKDGVTVTNAISREGYIYRNNFTDFVPFLFLFFLGIFHRIKKRKSYCLLVFFLLEGAYMLIMFCASLTEAVSAYYYYKNNYLMWAFVFLFAYEGLEEIAEKKGQEIMLACFAAWILPVVVVLAEIPPKISAANEYLAENPQEGYDYCRIYMENFCAMTREVDRAEHLDKEPFKKELYEKAYAIYQSEKKRICPVMNVRERYFEEAITNQWYVPYLYMKTKEIKEYAKETQPEYLCVIKDSKEYKKYEELWERFPKVFENSAGFIAVYK
ncbi:MAG: hypothetical protein NC307_02955 [Roseburia sp.]|nr:hypothetical protein [Roseburia sp.]